MWPSLLAISASSGAAGGGGSGGYFHFESDTGKEISQVEAMRSLLKDKTLSDVALRGSDGVMIHAHRCILASRSPVFRAMFVRRALEASKSSHINLKTYTGAVLQNVVEYIYTNEAALLNEVNSDKPGSTATLWSLASLADAATYFRLSALTVQSTDCIQQVLAKNATFPCCILAECDRIQSTHWIRDYALDCIKTHPHLLLEAGAPVVCKLSLSRMQSLLGGSVASKTSAGGEHPALSLTALTRFRILQLWASGSGVIANKNEDDSTETRRLAVTQLVQKHVRLDQIRPSELIGLVAPTGLVTSEQINEAFQQQALFAEQQNGATLFASTNALATDPAGAVWKTMQTTTADWNEINKKMVGSGSAEEVNEEDDDDAIVELLGCPALQAPGKYHWKLRVNQISQGICLGVESTPYPTGNRKEMGWCCDHRGNAYKLDERLHDQGPKFASGATVIMTLDLSNGSGSLYARVVEDATPKKEPKPPAAAKKEANAVVGDDTQEKEEKERSKEKTETKKDEDEQQSKNRGGPLLVVDGLLDQTRRGVGGSQVCGFFPAVELHRQSKVTFMGFVDEA